MRKLLALLALFVLPAFATVTDAFSGTLGSWTTFNGVWSITSGQLTQTQANAPTVPSGKIILWTTPAATADYSVSADITRDSTNNSTVGVVARFSQSGANCSMYLATVRNNTSATDNIQLYKAN